jgi:hypothetical protein
MKAVAIVVAAVLHAAFASHAAAQILIGSDAPARGSWEVSGGATWAGGFDVDDQNATLTRNDPTQRDFDLFTIDGRLDPVAGLQARIGFYLSPAISLEAGLLYMQPTLALRLADDFESAADTTATETLNRYLFDGSLVFHFTGLSFNAGRAVPFVAGGAGYLRDLHEGNELLETGTEYHGGAGLKYWFGRGRRRFGLRVEAGFSSRDGGFDFGEKRRTVPVAGASVMYLF